MQHHPKQDFEQLQKIVVPGLNKLVGYGQPASTPPWDEMWSTWTTVTQTANPFLESLTPENISEHLVVNGKPHREDIGTSLMRNIFHYWFHLGEAHALRQQLGHENLPDFVGNLTGVTYSSL